MEQEVDGTSEEADRASAEAASEQADRRLEAALAGSGIGDPREVLRGCLRRLRGTPAFDRAVAHYKEVLVPGVADGSLDPLDAWLDYARLVAAASGEGREVTIDAEGREVAIAAEREGGSGTDPAGLLLHVPEERGAPVTPLRVPAEPSPAQSATLMLLVEGRTGLA